MPRVLHTVYVITYKLTLEHEVLEQDPRMEGDDKRCNDLH